MFGEIKVSVLLVISSLSRQLRHSVWHTRLVTRPLVTCIRYFPAFDELTQRQSDVFMSLLSRKSFHLMFSYFATSARFSRVHFILLRGEKTAMLLPQHWYKLLPPALAPISSSGHVICRHDISLQNRMGAITRRRQMERAGRNKHPDGSCWNSELFLMYGPITQPFLFSLTLCNYFLRLGTQITRKLTDLSLNNHNGQLGGRSKGEILYNTINIQVWEPVRTQHPPRWHCESDHPAQGRHGAHIYLLFLIVCFTF